MRLKHYDFSLYNGAVTGPHRNPGLSIQRCFMSRPDGLQSPLCAASKAQESPRKLLRKGLLTFCVVLLWLVGPAAVLQAQGPPTVKPGETITFSQTDAIGGGFDEGKGCVCFPLRCDLNTAASCSADAEGTPDQPFDTAKPLSAFVTATGRGRRAVSEIGQFNDFEVDPGKRLDALLPAQVSGSVDVNGFLALVGVGQVKAVVKLEVRDVTDDPQGEGELLKTHTISTNSLLGSFSPSAGAGLKIDGGAPHGASIGIVGPSLNFGIKAQKQFVRDGGRFLFDVLLRRGRRYRLMLKARNSVQLGAGLKHGLAIASFYSPDDPLLCLTAPLAPSCGPGVPNLVDRQNWLAQLGHLAEFDLPDIDLPFLESLPFTKTGRGLRLFEDPGSQPLMKALELASELNIPTSFNGLTGVCT